MAKGIRKCMVKLLSQSGPGPWVISSTTGDVMAILISGAKKQQLLYHKRCQYIQ